jgi:hypothetical protein
MPLQDSRTRSSATIAHAWVAAANAQDGDRLAALSSPDIEIVGPRGSARGIAVLHDWLRRSGLTLETTRTFAGDSHVVMAHRGTWQTAGTTDISSADVSSSFDIQGGCVARYQRFDDLPTALAAAGLDESHEVAPQGGLA